MTLPFDTLSAFRRFPRTGWPRGRDAGPGVLSLYDTGLCTTSLLKGTIIYFRGRALVATYQVSRLLETVETRRKPHETKTEATHTLRVDRVFSRDKKQTATANETSQKKSTRPPQKQYLAAHPRFLTCAMKNGDIIENAQGPQRLQVQVAGQPRTRYTYTLHPPPLDSGSPWCINKPKHNL